MPFLEYWGLARIVSLVWLHLWNSSNLAWKPCYGRAQNEGLFRFGASFGDGFINWDTNKQLGTLCRLSSSIGRNHGKQIQYLEDTLPPTTNVSNFGRDELQNNSDFDSPVSGFFRCLVFRISLIENWFIFSGSIGFLPKKHKRCADDWVYFSIEIQHRKFDKLLM